MMNKHVTAYIDPFEWREALLEWVMENHPKKTSLKTLAFFLASSMNVKKRRNAVWKSKDTMSRESKISRRTLFECLNILFKAGWLDQRLRFGQSSVIALTLPDWLIPDIYIGEHVIEDDDELESIVPLTSEPPKSSNSANTALQKCEHVNANTSINTKYKKESEIDSNLGGLSGSPREVRKTFTELKSDFIRSQVPRMYDAIAEEFLIYTQETGSCFGLKPKSRTNWEIDLEDYFYRWHTANY